MKTKTQGNIISGNVFNGVHWDAKATEAVNNVSRSLLNLTELFKSQNITIDAILKIEQPENTIANNKVKKQ